MTSEHLKQPMPSTLETLHRELQNHITKELIHHFGSDLIALIHYGSTSKAIRKARTDCDMMPVLRALPKSRTERLKLFEPLEESLAGTLRQFEELGVTLELSVNPKTVEEFAKFNLLFLDWPEQAALLYDPQQLAEALLTKVRHWRKRNGAQRGEYNGKSYWKFPTEPGVPDQTKLEW